ncbi:MAG TPA: adenylate/guanylate cyclase domain-containing protein [Acidimicrobiales bacterium]|nr:adenylate/guanylate cyclase domain-containing protein [Acidimicrobiales bacterium]
MTALPTGVVTFVFTDVEGSTRLWEEHPAEAALAIEQHDRLVADCITAHGGLVVKSRGEGDSVFAVFTDPGAAVQSGVALQLALAAVAWPPAARLRVRAAMHTGEAQLRDGDYYGAAVNRCARLRATAHGGQVVITAATARRVADDLRGGVALLDLGEHRLKDLTDAEQVFQLCHPDLDRDFPPLRSLPTRRHNVPPDLTSFVGRDDETTAVLDLLADHRLVTLTGPGGAGKTRLAFAVTRTAADGHGDGARLVELGGLLEGGARRPGGDVGPGSAGGIGPRARRCAHRRRGGDGPRDRARHLRARPRRMQGAGPGPAPDLPGTAHTGDQPRAPRHRR